VENVYNNAYFFRRHWLIFIIIVIVIDLHSDSPIKGLKRAKRLSALTPGGPQIYDPDFRRTV
jgi:hypothetical protein